MSDRLMLTNMTFQGRHGVNPREKVEPQPFEVDVELCLDLRAAGETDDLARTVDYRQIFETCSSVIEGPSRDLIEALAEAIAERVLADSVTSGASEVVVRVRKPAVALPGKLDYSGVEIVRRPRQPG